MPGREDIETLLARTDALPTLPAVVQKLCSIVEDERASSAEIGKLISTDQVLSARVLKIVNSAFYGFPGRISTVTHALVLLGFQVVRGLVLGAAVIDMMTDSMKGLWEHSLGCSIAAGLLGRRCSLPEPEEAQVAGLLHDLGKVVLSVKMPQQFQAVLQERDRSDGSFWEAERRVLGGLTHCEIAERLARNWNLPLALREPIAFHHNPRASRLAPQHTAAVHVADALIRASGVGSGGDPFVPLIQPLGLKRLGLAMADLKPLVGELLDELDNVDFYELVEA